MPGEEPSDALSEAARLHREGNLDEAALVYAAILRTNPKAFYVGHQLGRVRLQQGRLADARDLFEATAKQDPANADALADLALVLARQGRPEEALACCDKSLAIRPANAAALYTRGNALLDLGRPEEAVASYDRALAIQPGHAPALYDRGNALLDLGRPAEALASFDRALVLRPDHAASFANRGTALVELKRHAEALAGFDRALALAPGNAVAEFSRALAALALGDFPAGWPGYERRFDQPAAPPRKLVARYPVWKGENLRGKRIIVYEEQGLGDIIQFARFLSLLPPMGARVTFLVRPSVHRLLRPLTPAIRLVDRAPPGESFDFQSALLSLPAALGTTLPTLPAKVPYLFPEAPKAAAWQRRIGERGFRVGICWQGNPDPRVDTGRSPPLKAFAPLAANPGIRLISLQKNHGLDQLRDLPAGMVVEELGADFENAPDAFIDAAAVMANLDLIVTSDTAIAHLAGALGRPTWVALKYVPDWRWFVDREDSPWYPTMRLFRQLSPGDWSSVFADMERELRSMVGTGNAGPAE